MDLKAAAELEQVKDGCPEWLQHAARAQRCPSLLGLHLHSTLPRLGWRSQVILVSLCSVLWMIAPYDLAVMILKQ